MVTQKGKDRINSKLPKYLKQKIQKDAAQNRRQFTDQLTVIVETYYADPNQNQ